MNICSVNLDRETTFLTLPSNPMQTPEILHIWMPPIQNSPVFIKLKYATSLTHKFG